MADFLEAHAHQVDVAMDGVTGLHLAVTQPHDVMRARPDATRQRGLALCRRLRQDAQSVTPVLMLRILERLMKRSPCMFKPPIPEKNRTLSGRILRLRLPRR